MWNHVSFSDKIKVRTLVERVDEMVHLVVASSDPKRIYLRASSDQREEVREKSQMPTETVAVVLQT